ncbi:hypothetical protein Achl_4376 (plasmid) [Pseudarthrobacter chlorophenolicus A6]|uniref:Uncharacterized protein n=1 Tax=Pseudarthrobacter chlorophenolicus (strain ATCC 700700 / DSM 12829 / CIP 107037 / JCM 12360 / KCTC 9906 / NCIMB 13794 / A6) TaxID=452863 RepID=B8HIT0_PSECP|nr:hypothetical protein [Pseudarthrobacter chlorophenolicus]ACL42327.1 hypothetical protein Achl_4376 [Pseudarthrobacter chlorophenolicus A6]SDQ16546.1 hypothetical protein SAMN04489738_0433 [Pseudarthrobacter chlorophenolicus]
MSRGAKTIPSSGGNPLRDNARRFQERKLNRLAVLRVSTPRGRRRKKYITKVETATYKELIIAVARELQKRDRRPV